jgi:hypothetical protein
MATRFDGDGGFCALILGGKLRGYAAKRDAKDVALNIKSPANLIENAFERRTLTFADFPG